MATPNELVPGRCITGFAKVNTARRTWGMPAAKLEEAREDVDI
jgi:hypothetical protein